VIFHSHVSLLEGKPNFVGEKTSFGPSRARSKRRGITDLEFLPKRRLQFLSQRLQARDRPLGRT
jgi:hypothetical protein